MTQVSRAYSHAPIGRILIAHELPEKDHRRAHNAGNAVPETAQKVAGKTRFRQ
jgi:hypothetical protein